MSEWRHVVTWRSHSWQLFLLDLWPWGETKFPCPPQSAQTNETDALFIIERAKPRAKAEAGVKITEKFQKAERRNAFSSFPCYFACQPEACSKYNISWIKDCCSATGNVSRWGWQFLRSNSGIKETVAYLDQRWAGMLAVRAVWKEYILIDRH